jgi:hypothetical protein
MEISQDKQLELLRWLLTTLDSQWLSKAASAFSPAEASRLGGRIRSTMGRTEMKAILSLLGKNKVANLSEAAQVVQAYINLAYGERGFNGSFRPVTYPGGQQRLEIEVRRFSGLDAIKKVAQAAGERPGLAAETLWSTWFEALLPDDQVEVLVQSGSGENAPDLIIVTVASESFVPPLEPVPVKEEKKEKEVKEELSPIAALLQIPLEEMTASPASQANPLHPAPAATPNPQPGWPSSTSMTGNGNQNPPASPNPARPVIGAEEPGANRQVAGALNQRLSQTRTPGQEENRLPPGTPPALQTQGEGVTAGGPVAPQALRVDPGTGRPLFAEDFEETAKKNVEKRKAKKEMPFMSRFLISKEAKELLAQSENDQPVELFSLATGIESIVQRMIAEENMRQPGTITTPVHVVDGPDGALEIHVGSQIYGSVGEVPPGPVLNLLQRAVAEWTDKQGI